MITDARKLEEPFIEYLGRGYTVHHPAGNWLFEVNGVLISLSQEAYEEAMQQQTKK